MSDRVPHLLNEAQSNPDWRERRLALIDLSYEKDESIVPVLMEKLNDPISEVRHAAIMAISRLGIEDAVPEILKPRFVGSPEMTLRWAAAAALGNLGDHRIIDDLIKLAEDEEWLVRNEALNALKDKVRRIIDSGEMKLSRNLVRMLSVDDPEIIEMAVEGLRNLGEDSCPLLIESLDAVSASVRQQAARTLGLIGKDRAASRLIEILSSDPEPTVRAEAAEALGLIGAPEALQPLIAAMGDRDDDTRTKVVDAVVHYDKLATEPVIVALEHSKSAIAKCAAVSALGAIGDPTSIPVLVEQLKSSYYLVRQATISALTQFGDRVVEPLLGVLSFNRSNIDVLLDEAERSEDVQTRLRAVRALGDLEDHRAVNLLKSLLSVPEQELGLEAQEALTKIGCAAWQRCGAMGVLGRIGDGRVVPKILSLLRDDSIHARHQAVETLRDLQNEQAAGPLLGLARTDPDHGVRRAALAAARNLATGTPELFDTALSLIEHESYDVRAATARILGDYRDDRAVTPLLKCLSDPSWNVRFSAENALCNQGKQVVPGLIEILEQGVLVARNRAVSALGRIGDPQAIGPLEELLGRETNKLAIGIATEVLKRLRGETTRSGSL